MSNIEEIYESVINDVINGVREAFLDENVDVDVLQQLRTSWEAKVKTSGAVDLGGPKNLPPPTIRQPQNRQTGSSSAPQANKPSTSGAIPVTHMQKVQEPPQRQNVILSQQQPVQQVAGTIVGNGSGLQYLQAGNSTAQTLANIAGGPQLHSGLRLVPVSQNPNLAQYTIMQGLPGSGQNFMVIPATNSQQLPLNVANLAQAQLSNPAVRPQQPQLISMKTEPNVHNNIGQLDGAGAIVDNELAPSNSKVKSTSLKIKKEKTKKHMSMIPQVDGGPGMSDSSSDDDLDEEDNDPLRRYANLEDDKLDDGDVVEEDPLNSNDDQSDDEDLDTLFDAEHVVVCQFEKVHRARTKWKFTLKDGIMHLKGKDYAFQKCLGEAEW